MRIEGLSEPLRTEMARKAESDKKAQSGEKTVKIKDGAFFSSESQRLSQTKAEIEIAKNQAQILPDMRTELIEEVKAKIKNGYYNTEEFIDKLTEKLIKDFKIF